MSKTNARDTWELKNLEKEYAVAFMQEELYKAKRLALREQLLKLMAGDVYKSDMMSIETVRQKRKIDVDDLMSFYGIEPEDADRFRKTFDPIFKIVLTDKGREHGKN